MAHQGLFRSIISITSVVLFLTAFNGTQQLAEGQLQSGSQAQYQSQTIVEDDLKNNPMAQKILLEIEYSKKQIAEIQKNQKDAETAKILIDQQRLVAAQLEKQAQQMLELNNTQHTPTAALRSFVSTVY